MVKYLINLLQFIKSYIIRLCAKANIQFGCGVRNIVGETLV